MSPPPAFFGSEKEKREKRRGKTLLYLCHFGMCSKFPVRWAAFWLLLGGMEIGL